MENLSEKTARYRALIKDILATFANAPYAIETLRDRALFDEANARYVVISDGWVRDKRYYGIIIDAEIVNGKIWLHADNTDISVAEKLTAQGVPKTDIVLGFRRPEIALELGYAAAA